MWHDVGRRNGFGTNVKDEAQSWHQGLMAEWWAHFNDDFRDHELDYYRNAVAASGDPVLDAGCGSGRLLVPLALDGHDVDGCDVSADMIDVCRSKAGAAGLSPRLEVQALDELDMKRQYRTIIVVGTFGLGSTRARDAEALRRVYEHLEPGGRLVLDIEVPWSDPEVWAYWPTVGASSLPEPPAKGGRRRRAPSGAEYVLSNRDVACDPMEQRVTWEAHIERWRGDVLEASEDRRLDAGFYFPAEVLLLLERAGFVDVETHGEHEVRRPVRTDEFVVFVATR